MRVTASSFPLTLGYQLQRLATEQARLQTQAGTGQRFSRPSEDPRAMRKVLDLQAEMKTLGQYEKNIGTLNDTLSASYTAITGVKKVSDRASEIATRAGGISTGEELETLASEVDQLIERTLQLANARHQSSYLFSGTKNNAAPYEVTRDSENRITSVTFNGSSTVAVSEIAEDLTISVTIPGANATGEGVRGLFSDSRADADFFNHLISLRDNLRNGNQNEVVHGDLPDLLKDEENILFHFGSVGAIQSRLETAESIANRRKAALEGFASEEADADLALTLVSLNTLNNAYTAALKTGGTIMNQSLLDYIR